MLIATIILFVLSVIILVLGFVKEQRLNKTIDEATLYRTKTLSERNQAIEQGLKQLKQQKEQSGLLALAIEHSPVSIVITDQAGNIIYINPKFLQITGYSKAEVLGQNPRILKSGNTPDDTYKKLWKNIADNKVWVGEFINKKKDGSLYIEKATIAPFRSDDGKLKNYLALKEDITAQRKAETEAQKKTQRLHAQREVLNKALHQLRETQGQLIQNEKMASLGQLTAGIAHEINNPVNFVYSGVDALAYNLKSINQILDNHEICQSPQTQNLKERITEVFGLLTDVKEGATRIINIVKDLNNFSNSDVTGPKLYNINSGIESTLSLLKNKTENIKIEKDFAPLTDAKVECYPGQINQLVMNLVLNAIEALQGEGIIKITTTRTKTHFIISISDNGPGIPDFIIDKIFDPFFTTKEIGRGAGLGLSISHHIAKEHNGRLEVETALGKGTKFTLSLPLTGL